MIAITAVLFGGLIAIGVWMYRWQSRRGEALLRQWSLQSHYTIVEKRSANPYGTGPGVLRASNKQLMYRVVVEDAEGIRRRALVKIGSPMMGVLTGDLVVEWE